MREYFLILLLIGYTVFFFNVGRTISVALLALLGELRPFRVLKGDHQMYTKPYDIGKEFTFQDQARELVKNFLNGQWEQETKNLQELQPDTEFIAAHIEFGDLFISWSSKTLQNWKALVGSDKLPGRYYEVTYDGIKRETHLDVYVKESNNVIPDPK